MSLTYYVSRAADDANEAKAIEIAAAVGIPAETFLQALDEVQADTFDGTWTIADASYATSDWDALVGPDVFTGVTDLSSVGVGTYPGKEKYFEQALHVDAYMNLKDYGFVVSLV